MAPPEHSPGTAECDGCGEEAGGWTRRQLRTKGWGFYRAVGGGPVILVLCPRCLRHHRRAWELRGQHTETH